MSPVPERFRSIQNLGSYKKFSKIVQQINTEMNAFNFVLRA